jgi:outer membrane protein
MIAHILVVGAVLSLPDAVHEATLRHPQLKEARGATQAARARVGEARAPLLPQLTGFASYQRTTANFVNKPGSVPPSVGNGPAATFDTYNFFNFGVTATQLLFDNLGTIQGFRAAGLNAEAQARTEQQTLADVVLAVRTAYFNARALKELVAVARDTLANQEKHLAQIQGFVRNGTRPQIDLAQAKADYANAQVQLINADNGYEIAKAQLNQAMGFEGPTSYDLADDTLPPVDGEDGTAEPLVSEALKSRFDVLAIDRQVSADRLIIRQQQAGYGPTFALSTTLNAADVQIDQLVPNWNVIISMNWPIFNGLLTREQAREAEGNWLTAVGQRDAVRQQARLDVETARLRVRAAKAATVAARDALANERERLKLAEGRYKSGVGSVLELGDAQLAATSAAAQTVQAEYALAGARAFLLHALGRPQ